MTDDIHYTRNRMIGLTGAAHFICLICTIKEILMIFTSILICLAYHWKYFPKWTGANYNQLQLVKVDSQGEKINRTASEREDQIGNKQRYPKGSEK